MLRARVIGTGGYLPARVLTNEDLAARLDTSDAWIVERTGIRERRIAAEGEFTSDLAVAAARPALEAAGLAADDIDLIVLATATPDQTFPATATAVQAKLGMTRGVAFDVGAVCSGFLYALSVADAMLRAGQARTALVIGAETFSRILDWKDRGTAVLFGDGAGAIVLRAEECAGTPADPGILACRLHSDGRHSELLYVDGGPSTTGTVGKLRMRGREVFRHAVVNLAQVMGEVLDAAGLTAADVTWLIPHQANLRILEATARKLDLPIERARPDLPCAGAGRRCEAHRFWHLPSARQGGASGAQSQERRHGGDRAAPRGELPRESGDARRDRRRTMSAERVVAAMQPIGAVAAELGVAAHVLRFWESRFPAVMPLKRAGGRRYYRLGDVALLRAVARLSRERGMTLAGIERLIAERGAVAVAAEHGGGAAAPTADWRSIATAARERLAAALEASRAA